MSRVLTVYRPVSRAAHRMLPWFRGTAADSLAGQRAATARWLAWAAGGASERQLIWVHAPSVGEWLAAAPVIRRLKAADSRLTFALTYSSPSLARWPVPPDIDRADYMPPDRPAPMAAVFDALAPRLVLLARGDFWPEMLAVAQARAVPIAVIGGVVSARSHRLAWPWRTVFSEFFRTMGYVGAVTTEDADRFARLGAPPEAVNVTGDPRHDQILERPADLAALAPLLTWSSGRDVLVAGSTHPPDEAVVLSAFATVARTTHHALLIVAPHDPGPMATERVRAAARHRGLEVASWPGSTAPGGARVVVVETLGLLADLYLCGQAAYVGGGFRRQGVHAVLEPAAFGLPVVFGPRWSRSADARRLLLDEGAVALSIRGAAARLALAWTKWLEEPAARIRAGRRARATITDGAATVTAAALLRMRERYSLRTLPSAAPPARPSAR